MLKIQLNIEETRKAIEESEKQGLDFIEVLANAIPIPDGWQMVKVTDMHPSVTYEQPELRDEP